MTKRMKTKRLLIVASLVLANTMAACAQSKTVWLDDLDLTAMTQGYGMPMKNKSIDGRKLTIGGQTFERGVGTHSVSEVAIQLDGGATRFIAQVGLDDEVLERKNAAEFIVIGDGAQLWTSGIVKVGDAPKECSVSLDGVKRLELLVKEGGDGPHYDHADWADAKILSKGADSFPTLKFIATEPYILTPPAPATPRINCALVFGVRPGSPFQFLVATTGDRPMKFSASGLPDGLEINPETGLITGKLTKPGTYEVTLKAKNKKGTDKKKFRIECGDRIALTPPMGWNSWNCFGHEVSAEKIKKAARAMVESGLINYGWTYINIDDSWQHHRDPNDPTRGGKLRDDNGYILPNAKFPDMKELTDYVHSLGLKTGIYSSPGPWTCGGCAGSYGYEKQDAEMYAKWGIDYLKYDWCSYGGVLDRDLNKDPYSVGSLEFQGGGDSILGRKPFKIMGDYLRQQPRDIVYNLCQYGMGDVWKWGNAVGGQCWRTTNDITDTWESVKGIALSQDRAAAWAKPGSWNDPDMLVVGIVGWGNAHPTKLKPDEQYLHISLWSLFSAPLLIGCDLEKLDDFTYSLLTNNEVIAINQDPLGKQATCVHSIGDLRIYVKDLEDGGKAVGFCNFDREKASLSFRDFDKLGISGKQTVRDLWRQKDIKVLNASEEALELEVPAHGVLLYKFRKGR